MDGPITYQMLSAVVASLMVVGGAWIFIDRRIKEVEKELELQITASRAELSLLRETLLTKYVSNEQLVRLEERLVAELREVRRSLDKRMRYDQSKDD